MPSSRLSSSRRSRLSSSYSGGAAGDKTRIDYGTGHECMFVCFLLVLARLNFFTASDSEALALEVFAEYVALVRRLQVTYSLEPVGSHGCLSLFVF